MHKRKSATLATAIDPVVLRAYRRATRRKPGGRDGLIQRLLVCYLLSDETARREIAEAGYLPEGESAAKRRQRLAALAREIEQRREANRVGSRTRRISTGIKRKPVNDDLRGRLYDQAETIGKFVFANCKPDDPIVHTFRVALNERELDTNKGKISNRQFKLLKAARKMFFALPIERRREICNGWTLDRRMVSRDDLVDVQTMVQQQLHLSTSAHPWHLTVCGLQRFVPEDSLEPIEFNIAFGITKEQALAAMDRIRQMMIERWSDLVKEDDTFHTEDPAKDWVSSSNKLTG